MIVDDESIIRNGIKSSINWCEYGINICGEAADGIEALEKLKLLKPDIVIMDIRMPKLDGLKVCQEVIKEHPGLEIIILSGYDEFEYARKAIELGVSDYLLKPIGAEELVNKVVKLKEKISQRKAISRQRELLLRNSREITFILIKKMLNGEEINFRDELKFLGLEFSKDLYYPFIIELDEVFKEAEYLEDRKSRIMDIFEQYYTQEGFLVSIPDEKHLFGILNISECDISEKRIQFIKERLEEEYGGSITIFSGKASTEFREIKSSYELLSSSLEAKFYIGGNRIIYNPEKIVKGFKKKIHLPGVAGEIEEYFKLMEKDRLIKIVTELFDFMREEKTEASLVKSLVIELNKGMLDIINKELDNSNYCSIQKVIAIIDEIDTFDFLKRWQFQMIESYFNKLKEIRSTRYSRIINETIEFIKNNYQRDISLEMAAEEVHVTPTYLSKLFKEETGINFIEWINRFRVCKAKELLEQTDKNITLIAEEVGYNDYRYFPYNFKKYFGISPRKYRKKIIAGNF